MAGMDKYLMMMVEHGVSDLHFCTGRKPTFRKDGSIMRMREERIDEESARTMLFDIMPKHARRSTTRPKTPISPMNFRESADTG